MSGAVRSAVVRLSADVSGLIAGYAKGKALTEDFARSTTTSMNKTATAMTSLSEKHKKAISTVSTGFGIMGAAAVAGLGLAVKNAADFDAKMSEVQAATQDGARGMEALRAAAIKAGADTVFSAGEAADGITNLAKAGISTADILSGGLKGALSLASAGQIDVGAAAEYTATALTQFGLKGSSASHVADLLAASANKAQGEVGDMATALNYAGIPAAQLGVSINQAVGTIALFAKSGLIGSQAGTTLRGVLSSLTSPSKVAASTMADLGISVFNAKGNFIGLDGLAQQLHDHMSNLTQAERSYALGRIFGNQQLQGANILYKAGAAGVDQWTKNVNDSGYAAKVAATKMNNLKGDIENLKGSLQTALIGTGEGSQTPLRGLTQNLTQMVNKYNDLGPAAQTNVAKAMGAAALLGGSAFVTGKTVVGINNTTNALKDLGRAGSFLKGAFAVGAVAAAGAAIVHLGDQATDGTKKLSDYRRGLKLLAGGMDSGIDFGTTAVDLQNAATKALTFGHAAGQQLAQQVSGTQQLADALHNAAYADYSPFFDKSDEIAKMDQALRSLAQVDPSQARSSFDAIKAAAKQGSVAMKDLIGLFPQYEAFLKSVRDGRQQHAAQIQDVLRSNAMFAMYRHQLEKLPRQVLTRVVTPGALDSTKKIENLARKYYLTPKQISTIMHALDYSTPAIRKVMRELKALSGTDSTSKIHADATQAHNQYRQTKSELIELGHIRPQPVITSNIAPFENGYRNVWGELTKVNNAHPQATLDANPTPALQAAARVQQALDSIHGHTVTITTVRQQGGGQPTLAGGGPVRGPGTKTSDSVALWGSDGEFMMRAAAVDKYGLNFMHRVNAMQLAGGGPVNAHPVSATRMPSGQAGGGATTVVVSLTDAQFSRLEAATERGTAKGAARGMKVLTHAINAEESFR